jgi:hypothetical protein
LQADGAAIANGLDGLDGRAGFVRFTGTAAGLPTADHEHRATLETLVAAPRRFIKMWKRFHNAAEAKRWPGRSQAMERFHKGKQ